MSIKEAARKFVKILEVAAAAIVTLVIIATLYLMWSVRDIPSKFSSVLDCETNIPTSISKLESVRKWQAPAVFVIEPSIDVYLARLMKQWSTGVASPSIRSILKESALILVLKVSMTTEERIDLVLKLHTYGRGVTGLNCATAFYFNKHSNELSIAQFALLIGNLKSPSAYSPIKRPEAAKKRRNYVINVWLEKGLISLAEARLAIAEKLI